MTHHAANDSHSRITGCFATRGDAERAVEHLVQEHGIDRSAISVGAARQANSAGTKASGADAAANPDEGSAFEPALGGPIEVSVQLKDANGAQAEKAFRSAGATDIVQR
ncbi:hypothetical protein [Stappia sp. WLB 29]|uniref:hypothetical protein n=1 Tax=Stappia sp. WLB 29 TaxID=2925220 RepID=UPI0020C0CF66|nr:hypothetical protein [Stappia sp. WLB 29]